MSLHTLRAAPRLVLAAQLSVVLGLPAIVFSALTPGQVVGEGALIKLLFLGRMALLLLVATYFLRVRGLGWADMG